MQIYAPVQERVALAYRASIVQLAQNADENVWTTVLVKKNIFFGIKFKILHDIKND